MVSMRHLPTILALLSLPAGILGYSLGVQLMVFLDLPDPLGGPLGLFVPLLVGGLFMVPPLIPFFDRMAKRDLAARPEARTEGRSKSKAKRRRR
jgi:hypothetical protein